MSSHLPIPPSAGGSVPAIGSPGSREDKVDWVAVARAQWDAGAPPDAKAFCAEFPLRQFSTYSRIELACEEFEARRAQGESLKLDSFCRGFPSIQRSLARVLEFAEYLHQHPEKTDNYPVAGEDFLNCHIAACLGAGASARVYLARDKSPTGRWVVLKVSPAVAGEAKILSPCRHPYIAGVLEARYDNKRRLGALLLEYRARTTLFDVVQRLFSGEAPRQTASDVLDAIAWRQGQDNLPEVAEPDFAWPAEGAYWEVAAYWGLALAKALAYLHQRDVLHSDLKPSNILLTPDGQPLLTDFNLSLCAQHQTRAKGGTALYMAPEHLRQTLLADRNDSSGEVDQRTDLFSLGVVLYETLSGRHPFLENAADWPAGARYEMAEQLLQRQRQGPWPLSSVAPHAPGELAELIQQCLAYDAASRPASASELAAGLRAVLARPSAQADAPFPYPGLPHLQAGTRGTGAQQAKAHRRRWLARGLGAACFLASAWAAGQFFLTDNSPNRSTNSFDLGRRRFDAGDYDAAARHFHDAVLENDVPLARLARARALHKSGDFQSAALDYKRLIDDTRSAQLMACYAYCLAERADFDGARHWSRWALDAGFRTAAAYNNFGYALLKRKSPRQAVNQFSQALARRPDMHAALHNRAMARLKMCENPDDDDDLAAVYSSAVGDIIHATELAPASAELFYDAARVHSFAFHADLEPQDPQAVLRCLAESVRLGLTKTREELLGDPFFAPVRSQMTLDEWKEAASVKRRFPRVGAPRVGAPRVGAQQVGARAVRLVDPWQRGDAPSNWRQVVSKAPRH